MLKTLYLLSPLVSGVEISNVVRHFHLEVCILSGPEDPIMSYGGFKRGGGCEIDCAHFFS